MSNVFFICNSQLQLSFGKRLALAFSGIGLRCYFYTSKMSVLISREAKSLNCQFLWKNKTKESELPSLSDEQYKGIYLNSIEGKLNTYAGRSSRSAVASILAAADCEAKKYKPKYCFLWMPWSCLTRAAAVGMTSNNVDVVYIEISNFPERTVFDTHGINATSLISLNPELIDRVSVDSEAATRWLRRVESAKSSPGWPPQSLSARNINFSSFLDFIAGALGYGPVLNLKGFLGRVYNKALVKFSGMHYRSVDVTDRRGFIFYPMQVTTDSQLLLNSDYDNWQAIGYALEYARSKGVGLVIKPHPAEIKADVVSRLNRLCSINEDVCISSNDIATLIDDCSEVITINSTVGQEAIIRGKDVQVLGRAFFKTMSRTQLINYLYAWLMPVDVFSNQSISPQVARMILEALEVRKRMTRDENPVVHN